MAMRPERSEREVLRSALCSTQRENEISMGGSSIAPGCAAGWPDGDGWGNFV